MTIEIQKDIPMPAAGVRGSKYPFAEMNIGDSFFVAGLKGSSLSSAARNFSANNDGYKFSVREVEEDVADELTGDATKVKGARVWRVSK